MNLARCQDHGIGLRFMLMPREMCVKRGSHRREIGGLGENGEGMEKYKEVVMK